MTVIRKALGPAIALAMLLALFVATPGLRAAESSRLNKKELRNLVANAKSAEDHLRLAEYYDDKASMLEGEAREHEKMAEEYRRNPLPIASKTPMHPRSAEHCDYLVKSLRASAQSAHELAADHRQLAKEAGKQ